MVDPVGDVLVWAALKEEDGATLYETPVLPLAIPIKMKATSRKVSKARGTQQAVAKDVIGDPPQHPHADLIPAQSLHPPDEQLTWQPSDEVSNERRPAKRSRFTAPPAPSIQPSHPLPAPLKRKALDDHYIELDDPAYSRPHIPLPARKDNHYTIPSDLQLGPPPRPLARPTHPLQLPDHDLGVTRYREQPAYRTVSNPPYDAQFDNHSNYQHDRHGHQQQPSQQGHHSQPGRLMGAPRHYAPVGYESDQRGLAWPQSQQPEAHEQYHHGPETYHAEQRYR